MSGAVVSRRRHPSEFPARYSLDLAVGLGLIPIAAAGTCIDLSPDNGRADAHGWEQWRVPEKNRA